LSHHTIAVPVNPNNSYNNNNNNDIDPPNQAFLERRGGSGTGGPTNLHQDVYPNRNHWKQPLAGRPMGFAGSCDPKQVSVRREWRELSAQEQANYLNAVRCLQSTSSMLTNNRRLTRSVYDDFAYTHNFLTPIIHNVGVFLPWHRMMMQFFEFALQDFCGYNDALPYWDWSLDSQAPEFAPVFTKDAFGGNGVPPSNCVPDGAFSDFQPLIGHDTPVCLNRQFDINDTARGDMLSPFYNPEAISTIIKNNGDFEDLRLMMAAPHAAVHNSIGGDMSFAGASPNDPIFYMHHSNVDRVWTLWQEKHPQSAHLYSGNRDANTQSRIDASIDDNVPMYTNLQQNSIFAVGPGNGNGGPDHLKVSDLMSTTGGGWFCYRYSDGPKVAAASSMKVNNASLVSAVSLAQMDELPGTTVKADIVREAGALAAACPNDTSEGTACDVSEAPPPDDRVNQFALRRPAALPESYIRAMNMDLETVRKHEAMFQQVTDYVNGIHGYVSRAAIGRIQLSQNIADTENGGKWESMTPDEAEAVLSLEMTLAAEAITSSE
ncbi:hypothetical protein HDU76_001103, partial [Blyttiomyces sp. JEL0837]